MRWVVRTVASVVGLCALLGVGYLVHTFAGRDTVRERFREGVEASAAIRQELGRDCNLRVDASPVNEEQVVVVVRYPDPPADPMARKELVRNTNIVVRRFVHHVRELEVLFEDQAEVIPSWDGGVALAGAPVPIGMEAPVPGRLAPPPAAVVDAGVAPKVAAVKAKAVGQVTIVTFPEANVFRGKEKLGRTPLFNAELPVGTHMLTLIGDDGAPRRLSVPVKVGKNKPMKMNLADLPAR